MRTGSSLTGAILQEYPGTLYLFEPVRALSGRFHHTPDNGTTKIVYPNGYVRFVLSFFFKNQSVESTDAIKLNLWKQKYANGKI